MQVTDLWNLSNEFRDKLSEEGMDQYLGGAKTLGKLNNIVGKIRILIFSACAADQRKETILVDQEREKGIRRFFYRLDCLLLEVEDFRKGEHPELDANLFIKTASGEADDILEEVRPSVTPGDLFIEGPDIFEDSWSLFQSIAFREKQENQDTLSVLSPIARKICNRCGNDLTVVRIIAAVLSSRRTPEAWEHFHDTIMASVKDPLRTILSVPSLRTEENLYKETNIIPQKCFAYCSLIPRDYKFKKAEIFYLWKAQCYYGHLVKNPEDELNEYFNEFLMNEYFIEDSQQGATASAVTYRISHLAHELMKHVAGDAFYTVDNSIQEVDLNIIRHASFRVSSSWQAPSWLPSAKHLRSVIFWLCGSRDTISNPLMKDWPHMKFLRTLCLGVVLSDKPANSVTSSESLVWVTMPKKLPGPIVQFILFAKLHLHYGGVFSNLSSILEDTQKIMSNESSSAPSTIHEDDEESEEISKFDMSLERLTIRYWKGVLFPAWVMPEVLVLLPNLVSVQITRCCRCRYLPDFSKLPCLRSLDLWGLSSLEYVDIGDDDSSNASSATFFPCLEDLMLIDLPELKGWFRSKVGINQYILQKGFPLLKRLRIRGCLKLMSMVSAPRLESLEATHVHTKVLKCFLHSSVLKELQIDSCRGLEMGNMTSHIYDGSYVRIGDLWKGLSSLHSLQLTNITRMKSLPADLKSLTTLEHLLLSWLHDFQDLPDWIGHLPKLHRLSIQYCPKLRALPESLSSILSLKRLEITYCPKLKQLPTLKPSIQVEIQECPQLEKVLRS